jgi:hypothetical protein
MSLLNTIAHPKTTGTKISVRGTIMVLVLGAWIAIGSAVAGPGAVDDANPTDMVAGRLAHEDFLRLNTTELEYLAPSLEVDVIESEPQVDPFIYLNTTALEGLVPRQAAGGLNTVSEEFLWWNIESLEYSSVTHPERPHGPR